MEVGGLSDLPPFDVPVERPLRPPRAVGPDLVGILYKLLIVQKGIPSFRRRMPAPLTEWVLAAAVVFAPDGKAFRQASGSGGAWKRR